MKKLAVLLLHGSGVDHEKTLSEYCDHIINDLKKKKIDASHIEFEIVNWHPAIQENQKKVWERYKKSVFRLGWKKLRWFVLSNMSDNFVYSGIQNLQNPAYTEIHARIRKSVHDLKLKVGENAPLIIISSSMGTSIALNYIRDIQMESANDQSGNIQFESMDTLTGIIMFGSTIPIYAAAYNPDTFPGISFPPAKLADSLKQVASWHTYYEKQDVLGYPLGPINHSFANDMGIVEERVSIGGLLTFWNPASHLRYWKSKKIRKRVVGYIITLLNKISEAEATTNSQFIHR